MLLFVIVYEERGRRDRLRGTSGSTSQGIDGRKSLVSKATACYVLGRPSTSLPILASDYIVSGAIAAD